MPISGLNYFYHKLYWFYLTFLHKNSYFSDSVNITAHMIPRHKNIIHELGVWLSKHLLFIFYIIIYVWVVLFLYNILVYL